MTHFVGINVFTMGIGTRSFTSTLGSPYPLGVGHYFTLENGTIGKFTTGVQLFSRAATISRVIKIMHNTFLVGDIFSRKKLSVLSSGCCFVFSQNSYDAIRYKYVHVMGKGRTKQLKSPPPHGITIIKGGIQVTLSRAFVGFVLHHQVALDFREWIKDAGHPDEMFFSSLNYNAQLRAPGAYPGTVSVCDH